jgi:hypothetical protein
MDWTDYLLTNALLKQTERKRFYNAKKFYWDCIISHGDKYFDSGLKNEIYEPEDEDPYAAFFSQPEKKSEVISFCNECNAQLMKTGLCEYCNYIIPQLGFQESQQMSQSGRFSRTFISPDADFTTRSGNRLLELQKWVTIDPQEMELKKVGENNYSVLLGPFNSEDEAQNAFAQATRTGYVVSGKLVKGN